MRERPYGAGPRRRSPSPRRLPPKSRDFSPSRHRKIVAYHRREATEYTREAKTSRGIEKKDHLGRDSSLGDPRFSEYDHRYGDRYPVDGRGFKSPRMMEKKDDLDRPLSLPDYGDRVGHSKRSYDEDSYQGDGSSKKFQGDPLLDGPRKFDYLSVTDYSHTHDSTRVSDTDVIRGGERDYYPQNRFLDSGQAGLLSGMQYADSTKAAPMEYESGGRLYSRSYASGHVGIDNIPMSNLAGGDGRSLMSSVASRYLNADIDEQRYFHPRDDLHLERRERLHDGEDNYFEKKNDGFHSHDRFLALDKSVQREIYKHKKGDELLSSRSYMEGDFDYMASSSRPKDYDPVPSSDTLMKDYPCHSATRDLHMSDMIRQGSTLSNKPIDLDVYSEKRLLPEERGGDWSYAEFGRSNMDKKSLRLNDGKESYRDHQYMSREEVLSHTVDELSHKNRMGDDGLWDHYPSSQVQSPPGKFGKHESLHVRPQDLDILGTGGSQLNYGTEEYYGYEGLRPEEHHGDTAVDKWSHFEMPDHLQSRGYGQSFGRLDNSPRRRLPVADSASVEPYERKLRNRHVRDDQLYDNAVGIKISTDGNGTRNIYNQVNLGNGIDPVHFSKKPRPSRSDYERMWRVSSEMPNDQPSSSKFHPHHSIKPHKAYSRDVKKRLGPVRQKLHVSQRLVNKYKPSVKKRLAPAQPKKHVAPPWLKNITSNIKWAHQNDSDGGAQDHYGEYLGDHLPLTKMGPPEKSEEFKQLVNTACFKFLKQINETPIKRKKYMEQGKAGILKCIVCGSDSEEFVGTESLAMHAFTSKKVGLRSQHLGLHRALCALMGWKIAEEPTSEWHFEVMTNAETSALKEDLIIWPPVVIVHNSTVDNPSPDERVVISTERLDTKLRDMGFGSIVKVCSGKPVNQSVMVVKFSGTLSGLQEAERLHQSYVESKHGRAELEQLKKSLNKIPKKRKQEKSAEREEFLYGHLGIAEDLDKLDFDTKKRCFLRSKKQILSIADVPV